MAYEVTATRRRPQAFDSLAGQEFVAQTLKNTIEAKRIAHAYLFSGPRGCGKTSTARILAKALNCANGPTATPCGKCSQCLEITKGASPDVIEIDGASNTSVNDVRQIKEEVLFPPQSSKYKIYIIDEVHMLSTSAFNALLKTIEEPPEYVIFIFATTELQKVPATIKSRCQQFNFRLVPIDTVEKLLEGAASEIGIKADEEALYWVARESTGSVRDAYTLFDQVAAFSGDHITYEKIKEKLGLVGVDSLNVVFENCVAGRASDAILKLDEFLSNGISIEQFISNSTDYLRSLLLIKNGITKEALLGQSAERFSLNVLNAWTPIQIERAISIFFQLYKDIRYSISPRYELELALSRLSWLSEYVSPMEVKFAVDQAKNLLLNAQYSSIPRPNPNIQNPNGQNLAFLMNPTAWKQNPTPKTQAIPPQPLKPTKPLPVLDELKKFPGYENAPSVTENRLQNEQEQQMRKASVQQVVQPIVQQEQQTQTQVQQVVQPVTPEPIQQNYPRQSFVNFEQTVQQPIQNENSVFNQNATSVDIKASKDFSKIPENELQKFLIDSLSYSDGILAASFMNTRNWKKLDRKITFEVGSDFDKMNFETLRPKILSTFVNLFGQQIDFEVILHKVEVVDLASNAPESVKLLCDTFRGQIVGIFEKTASPTESTTQTENSETDSNKQEKEDIEEPIPIENENLDEFDLD